MSRLRAALLLTALALPSAALAQTAPNWSYRYVPTMGEWNNQFRLKQDYLGAAPLLVTGGQMTGPLVTAASATGNAGFNIQPGVAPTLPNNGDMWSTSTGFYGQINGATVGPFAPTSGPVTFTGQITTQGTTTASPGWYAQLVGDTTPRVRVGLNATDVPSIAFGPGNAIRDTFLERIGAGSLRFGSPDAAAPVAQTQGVQNVVAGTSNTAGADWTFAGSRGTGTGAGGGFIWQTAPAGSTGSAQNALATALRIFGSGGIATGGAADQGAGTLDLAGALYNNGTAPTGTGGYVRAVSPSVSNLTITGSLTATGLVTLADMASISANTVVGSIAGGAPAALSQTQLTSLINPATSSLSGAVPAFPNNTTTYFRGDGIYATHNFASLGGQATLAQFPTGVSDTVLGYWGSTAASALAINNCTNALTYNSSTHLFGCNVVAGTGTVTEQKNTAGSGIVQSGNCDNTSSNSGSPCNTSSYLTGFINKLRNSSLTSWFHGISITITTAGGWSAEGVYAVPTGASVVATRGGPGSLFNGLVYDLQLTGATSVTDLVVRFPIESFEAAPLASQQVTCQFPVFNNTGSSITPTLTVKRANTQDATYTNIDVNAVSLQTIANGTSGILAYSWAANASSYNGLSIDIDFGNNFSSNAKSIQIGAGFDCRATPGVTTGTIASPPVPEIPVASADNVWNERYYESSYENGTAAGSATTVGLVFLSNAWSVTAAGAAGGSVKFRTVKRAAPSSISLWDGAGGTNLVSFIAGGAVTNAHCTSAAVGSMSSRQAIVGTGCAAGAGDNPVATHYAVDVSLTGG